MLSNGFDTGGSYEDASWARLERDHRDNIQREFDPASGQHTLRGRFFIP